MNPKPTAQMNPSFWDERYQKDRFMFSTNPNAFLVEQVPEKGGTVLAVGDGEGRNGVWLAEQGWAVTSLDYSAEGIAKTETLAAQRGVTGPNHLQLQVSGGKFDRFSTRIMIFALFSSKLIKSSILTSLYIGWCCCLLFTVI